MNLIRKSIISLAIFAVLSGAIVSLTAPSYAFAASDCGGSFLGFPPWYRGLTEGSGSDCKITGPKDSDGLTNFILAIGLNIVEMGLVLVAYLSGFFFLYGGFLFIFSQGKPESIVKGKSTMMMALIGLVLSIAAVAFINFVWTTLKI